MKAALFALLFTVGCTKATPPNETPSTPDDNKQGYAPAPPKTGAKVTLTSVTFGDDCGGEAPWSPPPAPARKFAAAPAEESVPAPASMVAPGQRPSDSPSAAPAARRCQQTSMALEVDATSDTAVTIKSVDVYDEKGTKLGSLQASKPRKWSAAASAYEDWNEQLAAGSTGQVTYVLEQAAFVSPWAERDRTYTVKVIASVGGVDQPLQTTVMVVAQPPPVPT